MTNIVHSVSISYVPLFTWPGKCMRLDLKQVRILRKILLCFVKGFS